MTDERSSAEIEREIEAERGALEGTMRDLRDSVSVEAAVQRIADSLRGNGSEIASAVGRQVRANPLGVALTGIGLAWLLAGPRSPDTTRRHRRSRHDTYGYGTGAGTGGDDLGDRGSYPPVHTTGFDDDLYAEEGSGAYVGGWGGDDDEPDDQTRTGQRSERTGGMSRRMRARSSDLRARMQHGLDGFSDAARERVLAARRAAVDARHRAEGAARRGSERVAGLYDEAPLVSGAFAMAIGAAVGAMLPRTRTEDRLMGAESDRLMDEARRIYDEEKAQLQETGRSVMETGREAVGDMADAAATALASPERKGGGSKKGATTPSQSGEPDEAGHRQPGDLKANQSGENGLGERPREPGLPGRPPGRNAG